MNINEKYNGDNLALVLCDKGAYVVVIEEGTGDNLWSEDIDEGYVDYINWTMYAIKMDYDIPTLVEWDGGMVLTKKYVVEMTIEEVCDLVRNDIGYGVATPLTVYSTNELSISEV